MNAQRKARLDAFADAQNEKAMAAAERYQEELLYEVLMQQTDLTEEEQEYLAEKMGVEL